MFWDSSLSLFIFSIHFRDFHLHIRSLEGRIDRAAGCIGGLQRAQWTKIRAHIIHIWWW